MLKALLVDDELNNLANLEFLLHNDCDGIEVAGKVLSEAIAREWLASHYADVIFLDINMPGENGFQFLDSIKSQNFKIIFITAYNEYALQAIRASAVDYLLKPVNIEELQKAVEKVKSLLDNPVALEQNDALLQYLLETDKKK